MNQIPLFLGCKDCDCTRYGQLLASNSNSPPMFQLGIRDSSLVA